MQAMKYIQQATFRWEADITDGIQNKCQATRSSILQDLLYAIT